MEPLSLLRGAGAIGGIALLLSSFLYFRGERWHRRAFLLGAVIGVVLLCVSLDASSVNWLRDAMGLGGFAYGRMLALCIVATAAAIALAFHARARADFVQRTLDRFICTSVAQSALASFNGSSPVKPVMIVMPALNEARNLRDLLPRIPRTIAGKEVGVLVVDDGSDDETADVVIEHGYFAVRSPIRRGQGGALRIGYTILARSNAEIVVTMDADNQHRPEDIETVALPVIDGEADFVLGSRRMGGTNTVDGVRSAGITLLSRLISALCGQRITDCSSGFKAFRTSLFSQLDLRENQFQNGEAIVEAAKKGLKVLEVPIVITERAHGTSHKGSNLFYGFHFTKAMVKAWWR